MSLTLTVSLKSQKFLLIEEANIFVDTYFTEQGTNYYLDSELIVGNIRGKTHGLTRKLCSEFEIALDKRDLRLFLAQIFSDYIYRYVRDGEIS